MGKKNAAAEKMKKETLETLKQVDENIWMMEYKGSYDLDALLEKGISGMGGMIRYIQKSVHSARAVVNPVGGSFACSSFNTRTPENEVIFGRNFDYKDSLCMVIWTSPEKGYRSMTVTLGTFLLYGKKWQNLKKIKKPLRMMGAPFGCMDGVNEKGLAIAILEIKAKPTCQKTGKKPIINPIAVRAILDRCATVDEALELLSGYDMRDMIFANYHYQIADAEGNSAIVEYVDNKMHIIRQKTKDENQKLTNFFLTEGGDNRKEMGRDRYKNIEEKLCGKDYHMTEEEAMELLGNNTLYYHHKWMPHMVITVWSSVYNCTERTMLMCAGMDYEHQYRFSLDHPGEVERIEKQKEG